MYNNRCYYFLGIISKEEIVELKCLHKVAYTMGLNLHDAVKNKQVPCLKINDWNEIQLKTNHDYYYQVGTYRGVFLYTYSLILMIKD